ncbi:MAG TPA: hypothetical protein VFC56_07235 [Stellaceae bacterium]|nr:hypothetical protein [Stellaceae bacterium]
MSCPTAEAANQYVIVGAGSRPCGSWLQVRNQTNPDSAVLQSWVLGYITSVNANVLTVNQDVADGTNPGALFSWIDDYCASHPLDSLARATGGLLDSLRAKNHAH